ncbi:hypothetical protein ABPG74_008310 [Tetrahymena malaccensis]
MEQKVIVAPPSTSFGFLNLLSLAIFYAKVEKNLYVKWWIVFLPTNIFFIYSLLKVLLFLTKTQSMASKIQNFQDIKLIMIWKFTQIIILSSCIVIALFLSQYLQKIDDSETPEQVNESLKHILAAIAVIFFSYWGYSVACKNIIEDQYLPFKDSTEEDEKKVSFTQLIINSILSLMGNTMTICAGGSCNSIYLSTVSAFFSAFGIPIVEYIHYLNFIAFFFIGISLISLYSVKNTWKYPPFIISAIGSLMICSDMIFEIHNYLTYVGNILIIAGAIWNSRLNKFSFANRKKNKKTPNGSTSA